MIEHGIQEGARHMTEATILIGRYMASIFLRTDRRIGWVVTMTRCAVVHDTGMIERTVCEIIADGMAGITVRCSARMRVG